MKILVTGGAGFIGSHVVEKLLEKKHEVSVLDNLSTGYLNNIDCTKCKFIRADISNEQVFKDLEKQNEKFDAIVHLAAIVSVPQSIENPIETNIVTLGGTINIFEFAKKQNVKKVIQASSAAVFGEKGKLLSPYAISKFVSELYADYYEKLYDIKSISLRFFNVYGKRQNPNSPYSGVISKFVDSFKNKKDINIFGDGKNTRDFIYVEDIARVILELVEKKISKNAVYSLGTGQETTLLKMIKILEEIFKYKVKINFLPERVGDIKKSVANISKIKKDLKFKPKFTLEQGLAYMLK